MTEAFDQKCMRRALALADRGASEGEVPVGALVVGPGGEVIGEGWNQPIGACDPTAHAEIVALREAAKAMNNYRLPGCTLYVTIEPCSMCAGALLHSRIERLVIAALEPKAGAVVSHGQLLDAAYGNHRLSYEVGLYAEQASERISHFFQQRRKQKKTAGQ